ncbi:MULTISPECIES: PhoH family protein [Kandleria]|jgi:phosphate starvation-inducible PhoH-like protein|uniref:PhoH-like protein n=1 Tax=Kandleria vitulina DSM 20405 TaxID=1410657 RepID=A0A0R2HF86_9FIRM|nr:MULTISPECIES: PhoH family protein [Kandleria]KRN51288.1 phosphate starvation-inducible protein PhoH, ATPase [Kandleria vitulina DSM 20405]MBP3277280.1 PhoH family protein [Kandleria sp.]MEE0988863.1 PhoH family protein [Kandleria vitulina]SDL59060.1 phosphate starvation-inducible protein PhoH [Kandleria vitulina]SEJ06111.1 phosphate starvation-inducible protein PhoH [Kandleria vitulina]
MGKIITLQDYTIEEIQSFCGPNEENIALLEDEFHVDITIRGNEIHLSEENEKLQSVIGRLLTLAKKSVRVSTKDVMYTISLGKTASLEEMDRLYSIRIARTATGKLITPKTIGQRDYFYALKDHDVVFAIGPAGTGKTYMAVVFAVQALKNNLVKKIILTRPAVEAGESLGFLPGDLKEKIDPYLRPLYDALYDMLGAEQTERLIEKGVIEIAPLAYMRGRTLEDAYVILDEAQNTTDNQMKMFLTRLGFNSKMIITGDITQIDLPKGVRSGLKGAINLLQDVKGIRFVFLNALDVVRHPVVSRIIRRYEEESRIE